MIVISNIELFNSIKLNFQSEFDSKHVDLKPVLIKNNLFIINEDVLMDDNFTEFFTEFTDYEIRDVNQNEYL